MESSNDRARLQLVLRVLLLGFVVLWLFVEALRTRIPFWLPFAVLLGAELEFVMVGRREAPRRSRHRVPPGSDDADLGYGELVEEEDGYRYVPPPVREERGPSRRLAWLVGVILAALLFGLAARADRQASWSSLDDDARRRTVSRLTTEASRVAGSTVRIECDERYAFTGAGSDTLGVAFPRRGLAYLDPAICRDLHDALAGSSADANAIEAVIVLAHEAVHLRGERREGVTECLALQEAVPIARRLQLDGRDATRLVRAAYARRRAERNAIRAAYALPASCRDGGSLDRSPGSTGFP